MWPEGIEATKRLVAYTAASQPPGTPTPICSGANKFSNMVIANVLAHLATNLRSV